MLVYILYPEKRWVPVEKISGWYHDAVANGEIDGNYVGFIDAEWSAQAMALSDAGLLTLGAGSPRHE